MKYTYPTYKLLPDTIHDTLVITLSENKNKYNSFISDVKLASLNYYKSSRERLSL